MERLKRLEDDGLTTPEVGDWAEEKYQLIRTYAEMFATAMKNRWESRAYIDLFAGAGRSRIEGTSQIIASSSILALEIRDPFDRYVFCDADHEKLEALRQRAGREHGTADVRYVAGDVNERVPEILGELPRHQPGFRVLTFCFADPYKCRNLRFDTIRRLAERYMDFLVLIPSWMDANRNQAHYVQETNSVLDEFFGDPGWRRVWSESPSSLRFGDFVTDHFGRQMAGLGYRYGGLQEATLVRSTDRNLPLYHLVLFSRHQLGERFWKDVRRYTNPQMSMFD